VVANFAAGPAFASVCLLKGANMRFRSAIPAFSLAAALAVGCAETVSEKETVTHRSDGRTTVNKETVKEHPDGTISVEKEHQSNR
jgi:hypothetical protein